MVNCVSLFNNLRFEVMESMLFFELLLIKLSIDCTDSALFKHVTRDTWENAKTKCQMLGMDLAMIKDAATLSDASSFLSNHGLTEVWIGLWWSKDTRNFNWVDGNKLGTFHNWENYPHEPNCMTNTELTHPVCPASYDQDCVRMRNLDWKTHGCYKTYEGLCMELPQPVPERTTDKTPSDTDKMTTTSVMNDFTSIVTHEAAESSKEVTNTSDANIGIIKVGASPVQVTANGTLKTPSNGSATACVYVCHSTGTGATHTSNTDHTPVHPIAVDRKTTSIYRRAHTSAYDERLSAKIMGLTGAIVIALVVLAVISIDAIRIIVKFTPE